jgi:diacylglycerol kinase family enzyme
VLRRRDGLPSTQWDRRSGERFEIDSDRPKLRAAIDGEPELLEVPVRLTIEPGALRVLVPHEPG